MLTPTKNRVANFRFAKTSFPRFCRRNDCSRRLCFLTINRPFRSLLVIEQNTCIVDTPWKIDFRFLKG